MMKIFGKILCVVIVLSMASTVLGQLNFVENYDNHATKAPPGAPWYKLPGTIADPVWVEATGKYVSKYNTLMINNKGFDGAKKGSQALLDNGAVWNGSDADPLIVLYYYRSTKTKEVDILVELSLGDVHTPAIGDTEDVPVLAYCRPEQNKKKSQYFDGQKWAQYGYAGGNNAWEYMYMEIRTNDVVVRTATGGPYVVPRTYTCGFDRISVYTRDFTKNSNTIIDNLSVKGGYSYNPTITAELDVLPSDDPNYLVNSTGSKSRLPIALLSTETVDVTQVDLASISIAGTLFPVKIPAVSDENGDGIDDLKLHFARRDVILALGLDTMESGTVVPITVSAKLGDCITVEATDTVIVQARDD